MLHPTGKKIVIIMSNKKSHSTIKVSLLIIMITRGDVQRVVDAFILEETLYWWLHPLERANTVRAVGAWDGYHWLVARQLAQDHDWVALKQLIYGHHK